VAIDCVTKHTAMIYDRGGRNKIAELTDVSQVIWNRVRDDISDASVMLSGASCYAQNELLSSLRSGRHELVLYRGEDRVWEGPITRLAGQRDSFGIYAKDVMHYVSRTVMQSAYSSAYPAVTYAISRINTILTAEITRKQNAELLVNPDIPDYNILPHVVLHQTATDAKTAAITKAYQYTVWEHIDSLASMGGIDYTVIGRAIHFWDTHQRLGLTPVVTQNDFLGDITVTEYGMELATKAIVTDGQGNSGTAGGADAYYGLVERLATAYDESEGATPPTSAEMASQAQRNLSGRNPAPIQLRVPDNSSLNPLGVLTVHALVPGVWMPLRAEVIGFQLEQMQRLNTVRFTETGRGESITMTLYPAAIGDDSPPLS
jgi:hypothetical protein